MSQNNTSQTNQDEYNSNDIPKIQAESLIASKQQLQARQVAHSRPRVDDEARELLEEIREEGQALNPYIKLDKNDRVLQVILNLKKSIPKEERSPRWVEKEYEGRKSTVLELDVIDPNNGSKKIVSIPPKYHDYIVNNLLEGYTLFQMRKEGEGKSTNYIIVSIKAA